MQQNKLPFDLSAFDRSGFFLSYIHGYKKDGYFVRIAYYENPNNANHFHAQYIERVNLSVFDEGCVFSDNGQCTSCGEAQGHRIPKDYFRDFPRPNNFLRLASSGRPAKLNNSKKQFRHQAFGNGNGYLTGIEKNPGPIFFSGNISTAFPPSATTFTTLSSNLQVYAGETVTLCNIFGLTTVGATAAGSFGAIYLKKHTSTPTAIFIGGWDPLNYYPICLFRATSSVSISNVNLNDGPGTQSIQQLPCLFTSSDAELCIVFGTDASTVTAPGNSAFFQCATAPMQSTLNSLVGTNVNVTGMSQLSNPLWISEFNPGAAPITAPVLPSIQNKTSATIVEHCSPLPFSVERPKKHHLPEQYSYPQHVVISSALYFLPDLKRLAANRSSRITDYSVYALWLRNVESAVSRGDEEALANNWNQLMHALNGNTAVFDDVSVPVLQRQTPIKKKNNTSAQTREQNPRTQTFKNFRSDSKILASEVVVPKPVMEEEDPLPEIFGDDGLPLSREEIEQLRIATANLQLEAEKNRTYGHTPDLDKIPQSLATEPTPKTAPKLTPQLDAGSPEFIPLKPRHTLHKTKAKKMKQELKLDYDEADKIIECDQQARKEYLAACAIRLSGVTYQCVRIWLGEDDDWKLKRTLPEILIDEEKPREKAPEPNKKGKGPSASERISNARDKEKTTQADHQQMVNVVFRILKKIKNYSDAIEWIMTTDQHPSDDFCLLLLSELNKRDSSINTQEKFVFTAICNKRPIYERLAGLSQYSSYVSQIVSTDKFRNWLKNEFGIYYTEISDETSWKAARQGTHNREMHSGNGNIYLIAFAIQMFRILRLSWGGEGPTNQEMHALNGNTSRLDFPNSMDEIKSHGDTGAIYREKKGIRGCRLADPITEVERQSGIKTVQGINLSDVPREMPIRGGIVDETNTYDASNDLNHPEALIFPREVRNGGGAVLIDSTHRLPLYGIGTLLRKMKTNLSLSAHGSTLQEIISKSGNIRPNQITTYGFYTSEVAGLIRTEGVDNGDSLMSLFVKLQLYNMILSWQFPANNLPIGGEVGKFDAFTQVDPNYGVVVDYNNGNDIFAENCGGPAAPVFPYTTNVPTIAFHASNQTVPRGHTPYYIRPSLLQQNDRGDNTINYPMLAMAIADFPAGLHNILINTLDNAGGNAAAQQFTSFASCVHITGVTAIDFVIPVTNAFDPARTQVAANNNVVVQPTTGPTAYGGALADDPLDVNWIGGGYISYDL